MNNTKWAIFFIVGIVLSGVVAYVIGFFSGLDNCKVKTLIGCQEHFDLIIRNATDICVNQALEKLGQDNNIPNIRQGKNYVKKYPKLKNVRRC